MVTARIGALHAWTSATGSPLRLEGEPGPHVARDLEEAGAGRVHPHAARRDARALHELRRDDEERRGGDVAGDRDGEPRHAAIPARGIQLDERAGGADGAAEGAEHALGVIAGDGGLAEARRAVGAEAGEENRALHLRAGDGAHVLEGAEIAPFGERPHDERRDDVVLAGRVPAAVDHRAAEAQRTGDAHHRAPRQRLVADEGRPEPGPREHAAEEAHRRARVAAVEVPRRRLQAREADPVHDELLAPRLLDDHSQRSQRVGGGDVVLAVGEAADVGHALAERAEEERAVADALVGGNRDAADERRGRGVDDEGGHRAPPRS
jgi:hypothetical protein